MQLRSDDRRNDRSRLIETIVAEVLAAFPARSTPKPWTICPPPSVLTVTGGVQAAIPLKLSEQANATVTLELFQPLLVGGGFTVPRIVGTVLSMFSVTEVFDTAPA
jgi:hypothetical protein